MNPSVHFVLATAAMATRFELVLLGEDAVCLRAAGEAAIDVILECDRRLTRFCRDSLLAWIEREATARPVRLDDDDFELFTLALDVHARSGGAFDVAHRGPGASSDIELDPVERTIRLRRPLALDLGAIAKGHALELAWRVIAESGVESAFLHGGTSSVLARGAPPAMEGWRVAIAGSNTMLTLRDQALSVSAQRGRAHIADPRRRPRVAKALEAMHARSGTDACVTMPRSPTPTLTNATAFVVARDARVAEAWSTAGIVLGRFGDDARIECCGLTGGLR